jgi:uncharacterized membrane protein
LKSKFKLSKWEGSLTSKVLTVLLAVCIVVAIGAIIYLVNTPNPNEKFTEFYILGLQGKAADYPSEFVLDSSQQIAVSTKYGNDPFAVYEKYGRVTIGIVDQEQRKTSYALEIKIDGQSAIIRYRGQSLARLEGIQLEHGQKWENEIGFAPAHIGENQKVEFLLYKDGAAEVYNNLHLWVNVK